MQGTLQLGKLQSRTLATSPNCSRHFHIRDTNTHMRSEHPTVHDVTYNIETTGPPVSAHPRRLAPERFRAAKQEFEHMLQLGIIRPSSSAWSSPLHMVPKKTAGD